MIFFRIGDKKLERFHGEVGWHVRWKSLQFRSKEHKNIQPNIISQVEVEVGDEYKGLTKRHNSIQIRF